MSKNSWKERGNKYNRSILSKVRDGDFQTKMESVQFSTTPREVVTLGDMENEWKRMSLINVDYE